MHWRSMTDREYLYAYDLDGKDLTVKIVKCVPGELVGVKGRKAKKPILHLDGQKPLALNATNAKTIAAMFGNHVEKWAGQTVTLYPTTTTMDGEVLEAIRIRPGKP